MGETVQEIAGVHSARSMRASAIRSAGSINPPCPSFENPKEPEDVRELRNYRHDYWGKNADCNFHVLPRQPDKALPYSDNPIQFVPC